MPINPNEIAEGIMKQYHLITFTDTKETYYWNKDTFLYEHGETIIEQLVQSELGEDCKTHTVNEVKDSIKRQTYTNRETVGANLNKIPLANCIYDFETGTTEPYTPKEIFLNKYTITWNNETFIGENPIDKFLNEVTETQEDALFLKEIIGYCFYRKMPFQNFFMLVGKGANGKSVFLNILRAMLGEENYATLSLQIISEGGFELSFLYGKSANIVGDLPKKAFQDVGHIKELTGGDTITAKQKFKNPMKFKSYAKLISACNEVPETPDMTDGFFRRAMLINFPYCFEGKENRNLTEELCTPENLCDFFKSCLDAFRLALEHNNFIRIETLDSKKDKYMIYSNSAVAFCHSMLDYDPEELLSTEEIYVAYSGYCKEKRTAVKDEIRFFKALYSHFGNKAWKKRIVDSFEDKTVRRYVVQGVYWKKG
jgi:P4 family phage/plasmid primase-like protien